MKYNSKINAYSGMRFYTRDGIEVTERIKDGTTTAFKIDEVEEADKFAKEKRSYKYDLIYTEAREKHRNYKQYGYGVPK